MNKRRLALEHLVDKMLGRLKKVEHHEVHHRFQYYLDHGFKEQERCDKYILLKRGYDMVIYERPTNLAREYFFSEILSQRKLK